MKLDIKQLDLELVRRPYQRSLNVHVRPNGKIKVTAGQQTTQKAIFNFLQECEPWLKKTLADTQKLKDKYPQKLFVQGESFLFAGEYLTLSFLKGSTKHWQFSTKDNVLKVYIPTNKWNHSFYLTPQPQIKPELLKFYKKRGIEKLKQQVELYSNLMDLHPQNLSFRAQKTRWGSCSSKGSVSLNWKLMAAPPEVLNYVVIHELAHLRHPNHSKVFWSLVEQHCPNNKAYRQWLKTHTYEFDFLAIKSELYDE